MGPSPPVQIRISVRDKRLLNAFNQALTMVADHAFENNFDAQVVELLGEKKGIGVLAIRRQHLGADRNDLCVHVKQCTTCATLGSISC